MFFVYLVLAFLVAMVLHNTWTRLKWRLGFQPLGYDAEQAHIVCKEEAVEVVERLKQSGTALAEVLLTEEDATVANFYAFARQVVFAYMHRLQVPAPDVTRDPPGIHERRGAYGELD